MMPRHFTAQIVTTPSLELAPPGSSDATDF